MSIQVLWPNPIIVKLKSFRSERFTPEETYDFIIQLILETEDLLRNPFLSKSYTEEFGEFKGITRIVIRGFKIYFEKINKNEAIINAVKFPGENS